MAHRSRTARSTRKLYESPRRVSYARFRREVLALLEIGPYQVPPQRGMRLLKRWDRYVQARWKQGRAPCTVADHLIKFEREHLVRPTRSARSAKANAKRDRSGRAVMGRDRSGRAVMGRDAEHPRIGETYQTRAGQRWEIVNVSDKRVTVRRKGQRPSADATLVWGRSALRSLKEVSESELAKEREAASPPAQLSLFSRGVNNDPDRRGRRGRGREKKTLGKHGKARVKKALARKDIKKGIVHTCLGPTQIQTLVFSKKHWNVRSAKAWAKSHGRRSSKVDITTNSIRLRQLPPSQFKIVGSKVFRPGLTAVLGCPLGKIKKSRKKGKSS